MTTLSFSKVGDKYVAEYDGESGGLEVNCPSGTTVVVAGDVSGNGHYKTMGTEKGDTIQGYLDMEGLTTAKVICDCATLPTGYVK